MSNQNLECMFSNYRSISLLTCLSKLFEKVVFNQLLNYLDKLHILYTFQFGFRNNYTTQNDFSFGVGVDYKLNEKWSLFVDVMRLIDKETTRPEGKYASRVNALTFGVVYHF